MTPTEHSKLDKLDRKMDDLNEKFQEHGLSDERRFGRVEKLVLLVGVLVVLPKFGAPSASEVASHVGVILSTIL